MDTSLLQMALVGYETERQKIEQKIADIRRQLNGASSRLAGPIASNGLRTSRNMSAAARRRIAAAQKKRWAEYHKAHGSAVAKHPATRPKRTLSAAGRKRIAEAARKRWAALRKKSTGAGSTPKVKTAA